MNQFLSGVLACSCVVAALFFWTYWQKTRDTLFRAFCAGFATLGVHWAALGILNPSNETRHYLYVVRFVAFAFILWGIVSKNHATGAGAPKSGSRPPRLS
jgi:hypothetical protein